MQASENNHNDRSVLMHSLICDFVIENIIIWLCHGTAYVTSLFWLFLSSFIISGVRDNKNLIIKAGIH